MLKNITNKSAGSYFPNRSGEVSRCSNHFVPSAGVRTNIVSAETRAAFDEDAGAAIRINLMHCDAPDFAAPRARC
jgi:uncharacterized protein YcbX